MNYLKASLYLKVKSDIAFKVSLLTWQQNLSRHKTEARGDGSSKNPYGNLKLVKLFWHNPYTLNSKSLGLNCIFTNRVLLQFKMQYCRCQTRKENEVSEENLSERRQFWWVFCFIKKRETSSLSHEWTVCVSCVPRTSSSQTLQTVIAYHPINWKRYRDTT